MPRSQQVFGLAKSGKRSPTPPPTPPTPTTHLYLTYFGSNGQASADNLSEKSTFVVPYYVKRVISEVTKSVYEKCPAVGTRKKSHTKNTR